MVVSAGSNYITDYLIFIVSWEWSAMSWLALILIMINTKLETKSWPNTWYRSLSHHHRPQTLRWTHTNYYTSNDVVLYSHHFQFFITRFIVNEHFGLKIFDKSFKDILLICQLCSWVELFTSLSVPVRLMAECLAGLVFGGQSKNSG